VGADLEDPRRPGVLHEPHEREDLGLELRGSDANPGVVEVVCEREGLLVRGEPGQSAPQLAARPEGRHVLAEMTKAPARKRADTACASHDSGSVESVHSAARRSTARQQRATPRGRPAAS
jgi:hypothetical protein